MAAKKKTNGTRTPTKPTTRDPIPATRDPELDTRDPAKKPLPCLPEPVALCPHCKYPVSRITGTHPDLANGKMRRYRTCRRSNCQGRYVTTRAMTEEELKRYEVG